MKTTDKKIISFYSPTANQGLKTLSLAYANRLANERYRVLYVELDTTAHGFAQALQIDTENQNILEYLSASLSGDFNFDNFIITKKMLLEESDKKSREIYQQLEDDLDYLILPMKLEPELVPNLVETDSESVDAFVLEYVDRIVDTLRDSIYDHVVIKLPNDIDHIFTYQTMTNSDVILSVISPSVIRLLELKERKDFLFEHNPSLKDKWTNIVNLASDELTKKDYDEMLGDAHIINFDPQRLRDEWALRTDSDYIREQMEEIIDGNGIRMTLSKYVEQKGLRKMFSRS